MPACSASAIERGSAGSGIGPEGRGSDWAATPRTQEAGIKVKGLTRSAARTLALASLLGLVPLLAPGAQAGEAAAHKSAATAAGKSGPAKVVKKGSEVSLQYTVFLENGKEVGSNVGTAPVVFHEGDGKVLPGLEKAVIGMKAGQSKTVTLPPEQAYGKVDPKAVREVDKKLVPKEARHAGARLLTQDAEGHPHPVEVKAVKGDKVLIDFNHPLAGHTLKFDLKVLDVK